MHAKKLMHGKVSPVHHLDRACSRACPTRSPAPATTRWPSSASLPDCLESPWTDDGEIMGVRHKTLAVEGVQFHPESILTERGHDLLRNFLEQSKA
jgi:anthranilate synthase component 2